MRPRVPGLGRSALGIGLRLLRCIPALIRHPVTVETARREIRRRYLQREADFLAVIRNSVYARPASPYRRLLALAGCEFGDIARLVAQDGVEGALGVLSRHGVFLTVDELKGRRPVVRLGGTFTVHPEDVLNPRAALHVPAQSSGSRGPATAVLYGLDFIRDLAVDRCLLLHARGGLGWDHAYWGVPGGASLAQILGFAAAGAAPVRWFSQVRPDDPGLHPRYRWSARVMRWAGLLAGIPLPAPIFVPLEHSRQIADWMAATLQAGRVPHLHTFASSAARLCEAAHAAGIDLSGAQFSLGSEPTTAARMAAVRAVGAVPVPNYGSAECGLIGHGCLAPTAPDDLHLFDDLHAVIQPGPGAEGLAPDLLLFTSLRASASFVLLNASLGDRAVLDRRPCGCPLEATGWATHVHTVRNAEKLTSGGMAFLDADVIRVLEEVLPGRFGGAPTDYQLVEEEATDSGRPRLRLVVHPGIGPLDPAVVVDAFLQAVGGGSGLDRVMGLAWRKAGLLGVERRPPYMTCSGKVLHRHLVVADGPPPRG